MTDESGTIPTFNQRATEAGLPNKVSAVDLIDKAIIVLEAEPGTAQVPETGKITEGFNVTVHIVDTDETVTFFCGQEVLVKALRTVKLPFRTTIRKPGRTYLFT
jgi:hypothetical protein